MMKNKNDSSIKVSVIIPAYNAEDTIAQTIESLLMQIAPAWEALIIDDGSNDHTVEVANSFVQQDHRIRLISQSNRGVSAARNLGISLAQYDWLLFLDPDDWIDPEHLHKMSEAIAYGHNVDAVYCRWNRVTNGKIHLIEKPVEVDGPLFPTLASKYPFAIHACIVRKSLVEAVGGFDISLNICEDWDLWQRIARTGAHFIGIKDVLAFYRVRPNSSSNNGMEFFISALRVLTQAHAPDPRLKHLHSAYFDGLPRETLPNKRLNALSWAAGLLMARGISTNQLFPLIKNDHDPGLDPYWIADNIFNAVIIANCSVPGDWFALWPGINLFTKEFLISLEVQSQAVGLARRATIILERMILQSTIIKKPITIGNFYAVELEITEQIQNICLSPEIVERLYCVVKMEGKELGLIELPVCDNMITKWVLTDAIAARFAWPIIGRFFEHTIYKEQKEKSLIYSNGEIDNENFHNQNGWKIFLQQVWDRPSWPSANFYDTGITEENTTKKIANKNLLIIDINEELPCIEVTDKTLNCIFTVGGVAVGSVQLAPENKLITAQSLRVAITTAGGFELCRACVREALLGRPLNEPSSIRNRLLKVTDNLENNGSEISFTHTLFKMDPSLVTSNAIMLARRQGPPGLSVSRRAVFPKAAADILCELAKATNEPVFIPEKDQLPDSILYVPELIIPSTNSSLVPGYAETVGEQLNMFGRQHFETLFAKQTDPWKYTHPYEQTKYDLTMSLLPPGKIKKALEIACAEGHFTEQLAPRVDSLVAVDISKVALTRAAQRCGNLKNIKFQQLDLIKNALPAPFDLIVCSEVLYYVGSTQDLKVIAHKITAALKPGGYLIMAHAHQVIDDPDQPGFDWNLPFGARIIGETFASIPLLRLVKEIRAPLYRVQLFQCQKKHYVPWQRNAGTRIEMIEQPATVPSAVEGTVHWHGSKPSNYFIRKTVFTDKLPILMYHRVAPKGSLEMHRYRVTPEAFEEQLQYLYDSGYYSVKWNDWITAMITRQPLPGRAIALTFDDGYLDFYQYAWPLLKKYGFTATVFLVANNIGTVNSWDKEFGEDVQLMGWNEIHELQSGGIEFGSHSATHKPMSALSPLDMIVEAAGSRIILEKQSGGPVKIFAYPYGDCDAVITHLVGGCGYTLGLSCKAALSTLLDDAMNLPRIEVKGGDSLEQFIYNLNC